MKIILKQLSSLEKVFLNSKEFPQEYKAASPLKGERFSYQIAYMAEETIMRKTEVELCIESELEPYISLRKIGYVPSELPVFSDSIDEDYLRTEPGLFPDPLYPAGKEIEAVLNVWYSLFVTVEIPFTLRTGVYPIRISFINREENLHKDTVFSLTVVDAELPKQNLIFTQWFHADCIASYYGYEMLSEAHWEMIEKFMKTAVKNGINMLLTPVFTPPLDTKIGGERPTLQLVVVKREGKTYHFSYQNLKRWINLAKKAGIQWFEISHLFSQWGAKYAPKIMALENGEQKRIFGWETEACDPEYQSFLAQFLPSLTSFLKREGIEKNTYFHISDEPHGEEQKENYRRAKEIVKPFLKDFIVIDAVSEYAFYEEKLVEHPVICTDRIAPFLANDVPDLWCYYCCAETKEVSNRFFSMPSWRNRIIGIQLYLYHIKGFLQWGFNFYYSQNSKDKINPFLTTDAGAAFPSGDAFGVYPGEDGPIEALSLVIFHQALQDLRAFQLLETLAGREAIEDLLQKNTEKKITFSEYPKGADWLLEMREQVNKEISKYSIK